MKIGELFVVISVVILVSYLATEIDGCHSKQGDVIAVEIKKCKADNECVSYQLCLGGRCVGACNVNKRSYVNNAICRAVNHTASWSCPSGYNGQPLERCTKNCTVHTDCALTDLCVKDVCIPGCDTIATRCNSRTRKTCNPGIHNPRCVWKHD